MKTYFGCAFLLLLFFIGCSCPPAEPMPSPAPSPVPSPTPSPPPSPAPTPPHVIEPDAKYAMQLAKKFCPIIHLKGEPETLENFEPDPVQIMIDRAVVRDSENPSFSEEATISNLLKWSQSPYYIDVIDLNPKENSPAEYRATYDILKQSYKPTVYARVKETDSNGHTILQYWLFYYLNDWRNIHEGDWELVQLTFPDYTAEELITKDEQPVFAAYSQHQSGQRMSWSVMTDKGLVKETHPVVYVAQGSHANYFTPGQFWSGLDFDDTGLTQWQVMNPNQLDIILLSETEEREPEWLQFKGRWGEHIGFSISVLDLKFWQQGPFGPPWSEEGSINEKWENPGKWASGLSEHPEPFWKSLIKIPGDWSKLAIFSVFSPVELHVYDAQGRHVGINEKGEIDKQIPGAMYIVPEGTDYKTILIPDADVTEEYSVVTEGTASGIMDIKAQVPEVITKLRRFLEYTGVPISAKTKARTRIKPTAPGLMRVPSPTEMLSGTTRDFTTTLEIDTDGDGAFEIESAPGNFETKKVIRSLLEANIDIDPDTFNLVSEAIEKSFTCYIELPAEFSPEDIDISTILLWGSVHALEKPIDVTDHDKNGVLELAIKFDRQLVIAYLLQTNQIEGEVSIIVTGVVNTQPFKGMDVISITRDGPKETNH